MVIPGLSVTILRAWSARAPEPLGRPRPWPVPEPIVASACAARGPAAAASAAVAIIAHALERTVRGLQPVVLVHRGAQLRHTLGDLALLLFQKISHPVTVTL
jgi:hypothetical protein